MVLYGTQYYRYCATLTIDTNVTFTGVGGWETNIFNLGTTANTARTITLEDLVNYKVNTDFNSIRSTNSSRSVLQSSDPTNRAYFTCGGNCVINVAYTNAIRIDSSLGRSVYSFNGAYTTAVNWNNIFPLTIPKTHQS